MAERPLGVTILGILSLVSGAFSVLKGLAWLGFGGILAGATFLAHPVAGAMVGAVAIFFGAIALLTGAFALFTAWGAFNLKGWAWSLGVVTHAGILIWSLLAALGPSTLRERSGALLVSGVILFYLTRPNVKAAFGKA
ncbi:MAG TPA: hypothetical protein VG817_08865 [Gemmatimonadales bacterium]|nr:hypothetical protein [Gemmatimonadales bacterium]